MDIFIILASGSVLILIINVLNGFLPFVKNLTFFQRFVECFKFAYAKRTDLADYLYAPEAYEVCYAYISKKKYLLKILF